MSFYIVSTKHSYPDSACLTFWGPNGNGYVWFQNWAGKYSENKRALYENRESEGVVLIDSILVEKEWRPAIYDRKIVNLIPNTLEVRKRLGLDKRRFKGGMSKMTENDLIWFDELKPIGRRDQ